MPAHPASRLVLTALVVLATSGCGIFGDDGPTAAASVLVIKALVHDEMRAQRPNAKFAGFTDVRDLAEAIADVWNASPQEVNGTRQWLTPRP